MLAHSEFETWLVLVNLVSFRSVCLAGSGGFLGGLWFFPVGLAHMCADREFGKPLQFVSFETAYSFSGALEQRLRTARRP